VFGVFMSGIDERGWSHWAGVWYTRAWWSRLAWFTLRHINGFRL